MGDELLGSIATMLTGSGFTVEDLSAYLERNGDGAAPSGVTIAAYVPQVLRGIASAGTKRSYATHYRHLVEGLLRQCDCTCSTCVDAWVASGQCDCTCRACRSGQAFEPLGGLLLRNGAITRTALEPLPMLVQRAAVKKAAAENVIRAGRGLGPKPTHGQGAREMCVTALRYLFSRAVDDRLIDHNPAEHLVKGRRSQPRRRALNHDELQQLLTTVVSSGDDPELDLAITWAELELAARRDGLVTLAIGRIHPESQLIELHEKGDRVRSQPCSAELIRYLLDMAAARGGPRSTPGDPSFDPGAPVLYFRDSTPERPHPISSRRFDTLHRRIQLALPWAGDVGYSGHMLRHTTGTAVERIAGTQVARRALGHAERTTTETYTDASLEEVARAISLMTGRPHPLATER